MNTNMQWLNYVTLRNSRNINLFIIMKKIELNKGREINNLGISELIVLA